VVVYVGVKYVEPYRLLVSDEVHMVTFIGKCFTKLCSEYATAAEGRVANYSNTHAENLRRQRNNDYTEGINNSYSDRGIKAVDYI